jgi:hypothetical protein
MHLRSILTFAFALAIATFVVPACRDHTRTPVIGGPPMVIEVALTSPIPGPPGARVELRLHGPTREADAGVVVLMGSVAAEGLGPWHARLQTDPHLHAGSGPHVMRAYLLDGDRVLAYGEASLVLPEGNGAVAVDIALARPTASTPTGPAAFGAR